MKITITASDPTSFMGRGRNTVTVDTLHDDDSIEEAIEAVRSALLAAGWMPEKLIEELGDYRDITPRP